MGIHDFTDSGGAKAKYVGSPFRRRTRPPILQHIGRVDRIGPMQR
jgi:hypothetical protein